MLNTFDTFLLFPELFLLIASLILLVFGVLISNQRIKGFPLIDLTLGKLTLFASFMTILLILNNPFITISLMNDLFIHDKLSIGIKFILVNVFCLILLLSLFYLKKEKINIFEYWTLLLLSLLAMFCLVSSCDLLALYLCIEFQSLIFYILASLRRTSEFSTEAGLKYFILGAFSSAILLFGFSLIYGVTGLTHLRDFNILFASNFYVYTNVFNALSLGLLCVLIALLFKLSASPFHIWSPDVYEGTLTNVTAFFSLMPKIVITSVFIRIFFYGFQTFSLLWQKILVFSIVLSLIFGTFGALKQSKWKRFLAFSSISHIGFILIGLLVNTYNGNEACFFYIIIYIIMTLNMFSIIIGLRQKIYKNDYQNRFFSGFSMLIKLNPAVSLSLVICLFSMGGIPPLVGFLAKMLILLESVNANLVTLTLFTILISCISCFYYLRIVKSICFEETTTWPVYLTIEKSLSYICFSTSFFLLYLGLDPSLVYTFIQFFISY
uniref:NADH dehydrogenase subunit 2 n=1 Tax=Compsopogon caeruleus TaxID=31354 RepID=A0A1Z1XBD8_9RHOD|nr:NADH dehydrogenase subunit 2 [Compsopogon caeruleus]ARX96182.1 NADH dehydrogenase subunit 2 [Compsopogon caeruleus]